MKSVFHINFWTMQDTSMAPSRLLKGHWGQLHLIFVLNKKNLSGYVDVHLAVKTLFTADKIAFQKFFCHSIQTMMGIWKQLCDHCFQTNDNEDKAM